MKRLFIFTIVLALLAACSQAPTSSDDNDAQAITEMSKARAKAFNEGDAATIAGHFTKNGVLMAPGQEVATGTEAIEAYYAKIFEEYEAILDSWYEEIEVSGDMGFGRGEARVTLIDKTSADTTESSSKYLNIVKRQDDGSWKTSHDVWNDN
ncbi:SgcJ/EcaC family oxidoreductase [Litoribacter ruber]|uniref:SgcJ/EcaC family oxidoreductase n=1 Tax=Litoribacter ruber TaxID=702568 RepID=UPI001BD9B88B|nr:SgcJ/EcaC family oxidoreductase [Litoribacter ruber]MBT0810346.1 SgcJ/EcaC family oxidoreductase [Litoribacter ruber]